MHYYLPGSVAELSQIESGECILFIANNQAHLGAVVQTPNGDKFILDFDYIDKDGNARFQMYDGTNFSNERIVALDKARIVPTLNPAEMGVGVYGRHVLSRALYVTDAGPVVYAGIHHTAYKMNLANGSVYGGDVAYEFYTKRWRIEVETGTGEFGTLREFTAS